MLKYVRTDFAQVGTTNRGCMQVVPGDKRKKQLDRIAVGGQNGSLILIARKQNDTQIVFKTPPGPEIQSLCLGGGVGQIRDKMFIAADTSVKGINKKGKTFFSFDTNMAEIAMRMYVHGVQLVLCGKRSYNHYHDCADTNYYLCTDDINDVVSLTEEGAWGERQFTSVLACSDATIKVIEGSVIGCNYRLDDIPLTLHLFMDDGGFTRQLVLYGTQTGKLGLLDCGHKAAQLVWEIESTTRAAITAITCYPMSNPTTPDVVVGKEDGLVEVYQIDDDNRPTLFTTFNCEETITGISCGFISTSDEPEIIVCTFTGWLFSLSKTSKAIESGVHSAQPVNFNVKMQQLKSEVEDLEMKVTEERARYEEMTRKSTGNFAFVPSFQIHDKFEFSATHGAYNLVIELVIPIDFIVVQAHLPIQLVEVERNASVVCEMRDAGAWPLLASYRCQASVCRLELRCRAVEGDHGPVNVFVTPKIHPKVAQVATYIIKPLSAHVRVHQFDLTRPLTTLTFTGSFSVAEAHSWLHLLLPSMPQKAPSSDTVVTNFECVVNGGTQLQVTYTKGSAVFRSDSPTTIAIIRDRVGDDAIAKQIHVDVTCDWNAACVKHCLQLLDPLIRHIHELQRKRDTAAALKQLADNSNENVLEFLGDEYAHILHDHDRIFADADNVSLQSSGLLPIYENLLISTGKLSGKSSKKHLESLQSHLLYDYTLDNVIRVFQSVLE